ncbi:hypothetical protein F4806DRAFT_450683 [Annulohypoxylon nitens]|nr:hypothetical protein F4806DRAFT_450683 [Annulohypoxylon nitens]
MDDLPSSPDPLGDEPPSSAHSTRRIRESSFANHDQSAISIPRSQIRRSSPAKQSPRKRIFELDVGDRLSPQKILVTVEAEEAMKRGLNRRLFQSPSPTRSDYRKEAITTTTVPLNDEIMNEATPRRRGRPRRTSNGTPMPRGRKRAGTPIEPNIKRSRQKGDPESELSMMNSDMPMGTDAGSTPKAKTRVRKTPKRAPTTQTVPSSQLSNATKRRRGRPRKALMPEDVAELAEMGDQSNGNLAKNDTTQPPQENSEADISRNERSRRDVTMDDTLTLIDEIARGSDGTPTPPDRSNSRMSGSINHETGSPRISHREGLDDDELPTASDYPPLIEHHSDDESDFGRFDNNGEEPYSAQDTLAHASDFSMIAVESLPSFQANRSAFPTDPPDMGSETNMIINETLESLRRSMQEDANQQSQMHSNGDNSTAGDDQTIMPNDSLADVGENSLLGRPRSPRRQRQTPLSRQILTGKAPRGDDSFSSIPDSILKAATPGRPPIKPNSTSNQQDNADEYDDSFSEIPDAVLEAATPGPAARTALHAEGSHRESRQAGSANRNSGSSFGSNRLPTPDDTSSSNAGSKRAQEDEPGESSRAPTLAVPDSNLPIHSSPPNRPRSMDFGPQLDREITNTPEPHQSSPQLPPSAKEVTEPPKTLEPPSLSRPSLSPIVRVGRTLQNVMSDRSSPEVREGSLGSPFRGSSNNESTRPIPFDPSNQSHISRSPNQTNHDMSASFAARASLASFNPSGTFVHTMRSNYPSGHQLAQGEGLGNMSDPFVSDKFDQSHLNTLGNSAFDVDKQASRFSRSALNSSLVASAKAIPPNNHETSWAADDEDESNHYPDSQTLSSHHSGNFATHGSNASRAMAGNTDVDEPEAERSQEQRQAEENNGDTTGYDADNTDLWDFEASRPTPKRPDSKRRAAQLFDPPPRRSKISSPWRRSTRRLIYREEIASPSQIEIEENPPSDPEEPQVPRIKPPRPSNAHSILLEMAPSPEAEAAEANDNSLHSPSPEQQDPRSEPEFQEQEHEDEYEYGQDQGLNQDQDDYQDEYQDQYQDRNYEQDQYEQEHEQEQEQKQEEEYEQDREQEQRLSEKRPAEPMDMSEYSMLDQTENAPSAQKKPTPAKSGIFGGFNIMSFFSSPATLPTKVSEGSKENTTRNPGNTSQPSFQKPVAREMEQTPRERQKSIWSTGLFPSIPQKNLEPSPQQRSDIISPAPPSQAKSNNTIQDTYDSPSPAPSLSPVASPSPAPSLSPEPASPEPASPEPPQQSPEPSPEPTPEPSPELSPEPSPEPSVERSPEPSSPERTKSPEKSPERSPEVSPQPSTPDQQLYPHIAQKQNFTPRPGSSTSLFKTGPSVNRTANQYEDEYDDLLLPPSDEVEDEDELQETSFMTNETEYERVPPREKPSRWDRTLSPSKSCFRSPMKPTTPGRVVAFKGTVISPVAQPEARMEKQANGDDRSNGVLSKGPALLQPAPALVAAPVSALAPPAPAPAATESWASQFLPRIFSRGNNNSVVPTNNANTNKTNPSYPSLPALSTYKNNTLSPAKNPTLQANKSNAGIPDPTLKPSQSQPRQQPKPQSQPPPRFLMSAPATAKPIGYKTTTLSQTDWTRNHWLRLDEMLQLRHRDPLAFQQRIPLPPRAHRKSFTTLLGKEIRAQGECLPLEVWHLEVVEAFKLEVGGWDERSLAKRVFALIIGEQRRRRAREARRGMVSAA